MRTVNCVECGVAFRLVTHTGRPRTHCFEYACDVKREMKKRRKMLLQRKVSRKVNRETTPETQKTGRP